MLVLLYLPARSRPDEHTYILDNEEGIFLRPLSLASTYTSEGDAMQTVYRMRDRLGIDPAKLELVRT